MIWKSCSSTTTHGFKSIYTKKIKTYLEFINQYEHVQYHFYKDYNITDIEQEVLYVMNQSTIKPNVQIKCVSYSKNITTNKLAILLSCIKHMKYDAMLQPFDKPSRSITIQYDTSQSNHVMYFLRILLFVYCILLYNKNKTMGIIITILCIIVIFL